MFTSHKKPKNELQRMGKVGCISIPLKLFFRYTELLMSGGDFHKIVITGYGYTLPWSCDPKTIRDKTYSTGIFSSGKVKGMDMKTFMSNIQEDEKDLEKIKMKFGWTMEDQLHYETIGKQKKSSVSKSELLPAINELSSDVLSYIFLFLNHRDLGLSVSLVSKQFKEVVDDSFIWTNYYAQLFGTRPSNGTKLCDHTMVDIPTLHSEQLKIKFKTTSQLCKEAGLAFHQYCRNRCVDNQMRSNRFFVLRVVRKNGVDIRKVLIQDREIAIGAIKQNPKAFHYLRKEFRTDREIILMAGGEAVTIIKYFSTDRQIILNIAKSNNFVWNDISEPLRSDPEFRLDLIAANASNYYYTFPKDLHKDVTFMRKVFLLVNPCRVIDDLQKFCTPTFRALENDRELVLEGMKREGLLLAYLPKYSNDREMVLEAVRSKYNALRHADKNLQRNRAIALEAVKSNPAAVKIIDKSLLSSPTFVLSAIEINHTVLHYLPEYANDLAFLRKAISVNAAAIELASDTIRRDPVTVIDALLQQVNEFFYNIEEIRDIMAQLCLNHTNQLTTK